MLIYLQVQHNETAPAIGGAGQYLQTRGQSLQRCSRGRESRMTDRGDVTSTDRKSKHGGRAKGKGAGKRCSSEAHAANNNGCLNPSGSSLRKMCAKGGSVGKIGKGRNVKAGDIMEMGGLTLIAIEKEGRLAWEPMNNDDNSGCEQMQAKACMGTWNDLISHSNTLLQEA
eukprot:5923183-Prymnesium_polylepis.1